MGLSGRVAFLLVLLSPAATLRRSSNQLFWHRRRGTTPTGYEELNYKQHFERYTSKLSETKNPLGMNDKCKPYISEPKGTSRGLIVLQHGFTACAGFWYLQAPRLVAAGYTVMAANFPGHGRRPKVERNGSNSYKVIDFLDDLPTEGEAYEAFALEMTSISIKYKEENPGKELHLVGCSHGGGAAVYMAMNGEVGMWDRVLLMNPFLAPPTGLGADYGLSFLKNLIPSVLPAFGLIRGDLVSWGPDCEESRYPGDPRNYGHGGLCSFGLVNLRGVFEFGNTVEAEARARAAKLGVFTGGIVDRVKGVRQLLTHKAWDLVSRAPDAPPSNLQVQVVATSNDGAVSNARIHFAAAALSKSAAGGSSGYCVLDKEFQHTYTNPIDKPLTADLWWMDSSRVKKKTILELFDDFLVNGKLIPTSGTIQDDRFVKGDPKCDISKRR